MSMTIMDMWAPAPEPPTKLGRHRRLSALTGLHVSPICLGAMNIGDQWEKYSMGAMNKESSFKLLDAFYDAGGNFIDTANNYQDGTSEEFIGEWMESRGIRDQMVIATKYTTNWKRGASFKDVPQKTQYVGNSLKSLHISIEASLKKLRTDYVDILYVHWWDYATPIEEVMNSLHNLVVQRKVLYLGISDTPAWVVAKANTYARMAGKTPFAVYQGMWNIMYRDVEQEIMPLLVDEGMAFAPYGVLASGKIRSDAEEQRRIDSGEGGRAITDDWKRTESERKVCQALEKVAEEVGGKHITSIAIAWAMQKFPYVFPIIGGRKVEHLQANLEALEIALSPEQIKFLDDVVPLQKPFPYSVFGDGVGYGWFSTNAGHFDQWPARQAIRPNKQ